MIELDKKDCLILNLLQENCRMSLSDISKKIGLSVDSTKKRINKMIKNDIFFPKIQVRPRNFGFKEIVDIRIKLHNYNKEDIDRFVNYLKENPRVSEFFSLSGEWNFSIVLISKDFKDLKNVTDEIRSKFGKIINEWSESLTTCVYKFEKYDLLKLMGYNKRGSNVQE